MKIAVASGKGGTGKSTVAVNLGYLLSKIYKNVCIVDCDVEEPNCHLFLNPGFSRSEPVFTLIPKVDVGKCIKCGKCAEICEYNALAFVKGKVIIFPELCHSCGSCKLICPTQAVSEINRDIGLIEEGFGEGFKFFHGKLKIGQAMSPPLIKAVKRNSEAEKIKVLDCPPGTSCPVVAAINGADFVILVAEPTPFGLNDLKLTVAVIKRLNIPFGIVINKSDENDYLIDNYALSQKIAILTKIPNERSIAESYSKGELITKTSEKYHSMFDPLIDIVRNSFE